MSGKKSRTLLKRRTGRPSKSLTPKDGRLFKRVSFFHVCCNRICYHAIRRCPYLSFMQAGLLLKPSCVFFRAVPELHQTQDSTDVPSELLRERGLYFLWSLPPHTRPRNRHTPEGKCRSFISGCLYTQPFTDNTYSCIYILGVYTTMRTPGYTRCTCGACFTFTFIYLSISVSGFDLTFHLLVVIHRLLFCKGIAGREHGKHRNKSYWRKTFHDPPKSKIAVS